MKLYLVLYLLGSVVFSVGPWSEGSDELCHMAAANLQREARDHWEGFQGLVEVPIKPIDIIGDCVKLDKEPYIKDAVRLH
jgi:hypothetical protein